MIDIVDHLYHQGDSRREEALGELASALVGGKRAEPRPPLLPILLGVLLLVCLPLCTLCVGALAALLYYCLWSPAPPPATPPPRSYDVFAQDVAHRLAYAACMHPPGRAYKRPA